MGVEANASFGKAADGWRRSLALRVGGILLGRRFSEATQRLQQAQWLPKEDLQARTEARLARLLRHAAEHTPFYRESYRKLGLSTNDLRTIADLTHLPVIRKSDHRRYSPDYFLAANLPAYRRLHESTSGSTGEPFQFYLDRESLPVLMANHAFSDDWYGLGPFDRSVRFRGPRPPADASSEDGPFHAKLRRMATSRLQVLYEEWTQERISVWEVGSEWAESIYERIEAFHPAFVVGYASAIATVADELLKRDLQLSRPVRGVITEAEPLTPARRQLIQQYFGAPIGNRYGLRELGSYNLQSCAEEPEQFHVITEQVICEIVREDGTPAETGEVGHLVFTDLHNFVEPFIRYDSGDLAIAGDGPCRCGRSLPVIKYLEGRSQECLRTRSGKLIGPVALGHCLFVYNDYGRWLRHYQLIEEDAGHVRLLVVPNAEFNDDRQRQLRGDLIKLLGEDVHVTIKIVPEIVCERSGKRPIIKLAENRERFQEAI
ncbi:MAG TPA: hypothetical protein VJS64_10450 [Pyrinomonadaceae bacterium]|nr:hypothetical protein [Pyrinomonadaceae bacterium]